MLPPRYSFFFLLLASIALTAFQRPVRENDNTPIPPPIHIKIVPEWNEQQAAEWEKAKQEVAEFRKSSDPTSKGCLIDWKVYWPLAKAGNLEARFALYTAFRDGPHIFFDHGNMHIISVNNIQKYLYFHSLGAPRLTAEIEYMKERLKANPKSIGAYPELEYLSGRSEIKACIFEHPSQACTQMFVSSLPTFERLASEIDVLIRGGAGMPCVHEDSPSNNNPNNRPVPKIKPSKEE